MIGWTIEDIQGFTKLKPSVIKLSNPIFNETGYLRQTGKLQSKKPFC